MQEEKNSEIDFAFEEIIFAPNDFLDSHAISSRSSCIYITLVKSKFQVFRHYLR